MPLLLASGFGASAGQSVALGWDASPTPDVGYAVYYGLASGDYGWRLDAGTHLTARVPGLLEHRTYYFAVAAYDTNQAESELSNEIRYLVPGAVITRPVFQSVALSGGNLLLTWSAQPGRAYQVQYVVALGQTNWRNLGRSVTATSNVACCSTPVGAGPQRFYRVLLLP